MLCDDLEGWGGGRMGGRVKREGIYVYILLIHVIVQQKLIQHCKAIILQLKINLKNEKITTKKTPQDMKVQDQMLHKQILANI